jgi:hypothetical protein
MHVTDHRCHLFNDAISFKGGVIADSRANGILVSMSVDHARYQFPKRKMAAVGPQLDQDTVRRVRSNFATTRMNMILTEYGVTFCGSSPLSALLSSPES